MTEAKSHLLTLVLAVCVFVFVTNPLHGQGLQISPQWKAHFTSTPVIANCVFEQTIVKNGDKQLFQFRWQTNAFLFRQIGNLDESRSNHIPVLLNYVGRFQSNSWAIEWTGDPYGMLWLFPNAGNIWDTMPTNGSGADVHIGKDQLSRALYYGINSINPSTIEWPDDSTFTALSLNNGREMVGKIIGTSKGLPTALEWHFANAPPGTGFILEYKYDNEGFDLPYFPNEIDFSVVNDGKKELAGILKVLVLKTSPNPMPKSVFDPNTYFVAAPPFSRFKPDTILYTNGLMFAVQDGHPQKVLSALEEQNR